MSETETVSDVLARLDGDETVAAMHGFVRGDLSADALDYEDWIRPLKLSGGAICLRCDWGENTWWYHRCGAGVILALDEGFLAGEAYVAHPDDLRHNIADADMDITPVLRAETPFADAADIEDGGTA